MNFDPKRDDPDSESDDATSDDAKSDSRKEMFSRRGFLGVGSAALAAGMLSAANAVGQESKQDSKPPYPTRGDKSSSAPGPGNAAIDAQNPDSFLPPQTDAGGVQTFKYPFGISHKRRQQLCQRRDGRRFLVLSHGDSAFHSRAESGWLRLSAGVRRRQLF